MMASKRTKGTGDDGAIIRRRASDDAPAPRPTGRLLGSQLQEVSRGKLGAGRGYVGTGSSTNEQKNAASKAYDVEVSDGEIRISGDKGSQTIKAPGLKGKASGKITTDTIDLFRLSSTGEYEVELDGNSLRFKRTVDGRVRDRYSVNLLQDGGEDARQARSARANRNKLEAEQSRAKLEAERRAEWEAADAERNRKQRQAAAELNDYRARSMKNSQQSEQPAKPRSPFSRS